MNVKNLLCKFSVLIAVVLIGFSTNVMGQTLMHSYTFEEGTFNDTVVFDQTGSLDGKIGGEKITVADGIATVSEAGANSDGWISLDGAALALNSYEAISIEAYLKTGEMVNASYSMLAYFGSATPGQKCFWIQPTRAGNETRIEAQNGETVKTAALPGFELDDGKLHHTVAVLSSTALTYYIDGVAVAEASLDGAEFIDSIGTDVANIFRGVDGWNDPNYNAGLEELNIYDGVMDAAMVAEKSSAYIGDVDARLASLSVNVGKLMPAFTPTTTNYVVQVTTTTATSATINAVAFADGATVDVSAVDLTGGTTMESVVVTAADGVTTMTYYIDFQFPADVTFAVTDTGAVALEGAKIMFMQDSLMTGTDGMVVFESVSPTTNAAYTVSLEGYDDYTGTVNVVGNDLTVNVELTPVAPVTMTFNVNMISKDVGENDVYVTGSFANVTWPVPGDEGSIVLTDDDGDHIFTGTALVKPMDSVKYKYFVGTGWGDDDPVGDRIVVTNGVDLTVDDVWNNDTEPYVAVDENALSLVSMYPNPVSSTLTIANLDGTKEIIVSNVLGKTMLVKPVDGVEMTINTSEFRTGIYIVTIVGQNSTRSERIIKQ